ncbi:hypothetical protein H920_00359 [Fukomys damarensis]|uniref:Uncharacterized protein n=1 Tax=Fukomys damarensis TaxID=885580 RepID=A0A091ER82_FUKDA|nr:hypothetical protein H920_00359 [Fukomys damarensis]
MPSDFHWLLTSSYYEKQKPGGGDSAVTERSSRISGRQTRPSDPLKHLDMYRNIICKCFPQDARCLDTSLAAGINGRGHMHLPCTCMTLVTLPPYMGDLSFQPDRRILFVERACV